MQSNMPYLYDQPQAFIERVIQHVQKVIIGKKESIEQTIIALLSGGHVLLEDVPGVGKTMLVKTLAKTIDCSFQRIQFTPDLLPSDVTGVSIYNQKTQQFEYREGPIMANIVLADEINRTSPKTQSALLEAMEEKKVTIDGHTHMLPQPFLILATQNPLDFEGTYRLPEAQLDRFLLKIKLGYPSKQDELEILTRLQDRHPLDSLKPILFKEELQHLQQQVRKIHMDDSLKQYIVELAEATRNHPDIELGASPRASLALMRAAQSAAFISGRVYVIPDDIKKMLEPVIVHRLILTSDATIANRQPRIIVQEIADSIPVPSLRSAAGE